MLSAQIKALQTLSEKLLQAQIRACLLLSGDTAWQEALCQAFLAQTPSKQGLWVGEHSPFAQAKAIQPKTANLLLGQETDFVIFSATEGIDPNTLGILSGMIKAGGWCIILLPEHQAWLNLPNKSCEKHLSFPLKAKDTLKGFNAFLWQQLTQHAIHLTQHQDPKCLETWLNQFPLNQTVPPQTLPTQDQLEAVKLIQKVAFGHRKRPLLITADRGRGKSSALGLAAVALIEAGKRHITLTAARPDQVKSALQILENAGLTEFIFFKAPDELIANPIQTDLLLVDEAAHLPLPMLQTLIQTYHRLVLASTSQGYEGSGRGFELKLSAFLDKTTPGWKRFELHTPIRWRAGDWLENTLNQTLLLTPCKVINHPEDDAPIVYQTLSVARLLANPQQLHELFQLLVSAHYQTSPNDLMQLLEVPNLTLLVAQRNQQILGALIAISEGDLPPPDPKHPRRLQGHLFPQKLYQQTGHPDWLRLKGLRVMRIAVQDAWQNQQLGSHLLQHLTQFAKQQPFDYVASSFGVTAQLLNFWTQNHFQTLGLGFKKDHASGTYAINLCLPLSQSAQDLVQVTQQMVAPQWVYCLQSHYHDLEIPTLLAILKTLPFKAAPFPFGYLQQQPYESISLALRDWALSHLDFLSTQADTQLQTQFSRKLLLNWPWENLVSSQLNSRKQLEAKLQNSLAEYLQK